MERHVRKLEAKYQRAEQQVARAECWRTEDAEIVLVGYGIMGRILKAVVELARAAESGRACSGRSRCSRSPRCRCGSSAGTPRHSWWWSSAPANCATMSAWRSKAAGRWSSSAAWAATCPPPRRCWSSCGRNSLAADPAAGGGGAGPWLATRSLTKRPMLLRPLRPQGGIAAPDALLPGMRPRHCAQTAGAGHRRTGGAGPHRADQPGGLLGLRATTISTSATCRSAHGRAPAVATAVKRSRPGQHRDRLPGRWRPGGHRHRRDHPRRQSRRAHHRHFRQQRHLRDDRRTDGAHHAARQEDHHLAVRPIRRNEGYPIHVCELLDSLEAPVFIERVALGNNKQIMHAAKVI